MDAMGLQQLLMLPSESNRLPASYQLPLCVQWPSIFSTKDNYNSRGMATARPATMKPVVPDRYSRDVRTSLLSVTSTITSRNFFLSNIVSKGRVE
ncbi:hypothetical protein CEXT_340471 [Caerostris extrusa]|uniref:Uncharacterized protein n=1 Tax=Caerostris extrusa TaxID=172846 RepID=A0AAV4U1G5_CAEEX|nr:hypothetical protein CEXT_340471 [Caerostris extrusa]